MLINHCHWRRFWCGILRLFRISNACHAILSIKTW